jgi:hypothetical protein
MEGGGGLLGGWTASETRRQRASRVVVVVFIPNGLRVPLAMATATGSYRMKRRHGEEELEQRNAMIWRVREEIGSSNSGDHYCCLESVAMASSPRQGRARDLPPLSLEGERSEGGIEWIATRALGSGLRLYTEIVVSV